MHLHNVQTGTAAAFDSWEQFVETLVKRFQLVSPEHTARDKLAVLQQTKSARAYADLFNAYMLDIPSMHEQDTVDRFIRGLKPELRLQVELRHPATLAETLELAIQVDAFMWQNRYSPHDDSSMSSTRSNVPYSEWQRSGGNNGPQPMELGSAQARSTWRSTPGQYNGSKEQRPSGASLPMCYNCKETGHVRRFCPLRKARQGDDRSQSAYPARQR
jgi:hypothetical protein